MKLWSVRLRLVFSAMLFALAAGGGGGGCQGGAPGKEVTMEESQAIARDFVTREPTYAYDGSSLKLTGTVAGKEAGSWQFT